VVVAPQSVIADTPQEEIFTMDSKVTHDIKPVIRYPENSALSRNIKTLNNVKKFSENLKLSHERSEEEITNTPPDIRQEIDRNVEMKRPGKEDSSDSLTGEVPMKL
jgi:hypothetical protein